MPSTTSLRAAGTGEDRDDAVVHRVTDGAAVGGVQLELHVGGAGRGFQDRLEGRVLDASFRSLATGRQVPVSA